MRLRNCEGCRKRSGANLYLSTKRRACEDFVGSGPFGPLAMSLGLRPKQLNKSDSGGRESEASYEAKLRSHKHLHIMKTMAGSYGWGRTGYVETRDQRFEVVDRSVLVRVGRQLHIPKRLAKQMDVWPCYTLDLLQEPAKRHGD